MGYITQEGLDNLKKYKYISGGRTKLDEIMNHWWEFVVQLLPMNMAPNLVTLVGLIINISGAMIYLFYDTTLTQKFPGWMYFYSATCAFAYQTLDAVDGKQARRTGTSSPLGQLFDHGCDAVTLFFGLMMFFQIGRTGNSWEYFLLTWSLTLTFYTQQWEEYHTHVFRTCIGNWGVTEGLLLQLSYLYAVALSNGIVAEWTVGTILPFIPFPEVIKNFTMLQVGSFAIFYNATTYSYLNIKSGLEAAKCSKQEALLGLSPLPIFWVEILLVFTTDWAWRNPALALLLLGPSYCLMTCKHIVSSVCKMPFIPLQTSPAVYLIFILNKILIPLIPAFKQFQLAGAINQDLLPESYIALFVFIFTLIAFLRFVVSVIDQITKSLDIYCLTIKKKTQ